MADIWRSCVVSSDIEVVTWQGEEDSVILNVPRGTTHTIEKNTLDILRLCVFLGQGTVPEFCREMGFSDQEIDCDLVSTIEHYLKNLQIHEFVEKVGV